MLENFIKKEKKSITIENLHKVYFYYIFV